MSNYTKSNFNIKQIHNSWTTQWICTIYTSSERYGQSKHNLLDPNLTMPSGLNRKLKIQARRNKIAVGYLSQWERRLVSRCTRVHECTLLSLSIPTDICHSCTGYHTVVSEMTLLFTRGILYVCMFSALTWQWIERQLVFHVIWNTVWAGSQKSTFTSNLEATNGTAG